MVSHEQMIWLYMLTMSKLHDYYGPLEFRLHQVGDQDRKAGSSRKHAKKTVCIGWNLRGNARRKGIQVHTQKSASWYSCTVCIWSFRITLFTKFYRTFLSLLHICTLMTARKSFLRVCTDGAIWLALYSPWPWPATLLCSIRIFTQMNPKIPKWPVIWYYFVYYEMLSKIWVDETYFTSVLVFMHFLKKSLLLR